MLSNQSRKQIKNKQNQARSVSNRRGSNPENGGGVRQYAGALSLHHVYCHAYFRCGHLFHRAMGLPNRTGLELRRFRHVQTGMCASIAAGIVTVV